MKFVSKASNYLLVLKSAVGSNRETGTPGVPGVTIRFEDGVAVVEDEKLCRMVMECNEYNVDFHCVDDGPDPFALQRKEIEPRHQITELEFGHVAKTHGSPTTVKLPAAIAAEVQNKINAGIKAGIKELIPTIVSELKKQAGDVVNNAPVVEDEVPAKKASSKKKSSGTTKKKSSAKKKVASTVQETETSETEINLTPAIEEQDKV